MKVTSDRRKKSHWRLQKVDSSGQGRRRLAEILRSWKSNAETGQLRESVERYIGNTWIESTSDHDRTYKLGSGFHDNAIAGIGACP